MRVFNIIAWILLGLVPLSLQASSASNWRSHLSSAGLLEEVISQVENPHVFDWRKASFQLELGLGYPVETNNFESRAYELALGIPLNGGMIFRTGLRRVKVSETYSSRLIGRTPFLQEAGISRYDLIAGLDYSILEGRSITRFSKWIPDLQHVLFLKAAGYYSHPNASDMIKLKDKPQAYPGQDVFRSAVNLELGLKWQLYLPQAFGFYLEASQHYPLSRGDHLHSWLYFAGGLTWSAK